MTYLCYENKMTKSMNKVYSAKTRTSGFHRLNLSHGFDWFSQRFLEIFQQGILRHARRQWTKGISNLPRTLGDQKMGFLVPLERGSSNPEGESESPILGELNPPKNWRIPQRYQEITTKGVLRALLLEFVREGQNGEWRGKFHTGRG
jgi:hypothetical protein